MVYSNDAYYSNTMDLSVMYLPQLIHEAAKGPSKLALHAQRVVSIDLSLVAPTKEVMHDGHCVRQALDAAVHEAGVAQIGQAC